MYLHKKHQNIHRRSPTKYLAGVRVDSCCFCTAHIFLVMSSTTTSPSRNKLLRLIITRDKTHVQGSRCIQLTYRQGRVHPQSKDSWKSLVMFGVNDEFELKHGFLNDHGLSFLVHPRKENDSKSQVFSNVFLEFPDIFVTAPPESCVHVLNKIANDAFHNYIDQYIGFKFSLFSILTEPYWAWGDILVDDKPKVFGCQPTRWTYVLFDQSYNRALVKMPLLLRLDA